MKILLTGSTGFVGMAFLDAIPSSWEVLCISRKETFPLQTLKPNIKFLLSSLQDIKMLSHEIKLFGPDVCLHLAWEGLPDYGYDACSLNFNYFQSLLDVLIKNSIRKIIVAGSCFEVGLFKGLAPPTIIEGMSSNLLGSYKNLHIRLLESLANASLIDFTWARIFYLYGPNQRENSLVPSIIKGFLNNQPIIPRTKDSFHDFIFIDDCIEMLVKMVERYNVNGVYNIGSGSLTSVSQLYNAIVRELNASSDNLLSVDSIEIATDKYLYADLDQSISNFQWKPNTTLEVAIKKTCEYYTSRK